MYWFSRQEPGTQKRRHSINTAGLPASTTDEHMFAKLFPTRSLTVTPPVHADSDLPCAPGGAIYDYAV
jgi:hypothetical protein